MKDEKILAPKDQKVYAGTDTRDVYHDGWSVSVEVPIPREQHKKIQEEYICAMTEYSTKEVMAKTKIKNEQMIKDKYQSPL